MVRSLLVDIGNTRIKWALVTGDHWERGTPHAHQGRWKSVFRRAWGERDAPDRVAVSNVGGSEAEEAVRQWCESRWSLEPWFARSESLTGSLINDYRDPASLGVDRWMSMIGARTLTKSAVVVVDCGTTITMDLLGEDDRFLGGVIMPGDHMGLRILNRETADIPEVEHRPRISPGLSTAECVNSGVYLSIIGGIGRTISEMQMLAGARPVIIVSGGAAERIIPFMEFKLDHQPDIVLKGLLEVAG